MPTDEVFPLSPAEDGSPRNLIVLGEKIMAEQFFFDLLPQWLDGHRDEWVYVTCDGSHGFCETRDEADLAAEAAGLDARQYVVRHVAAYELRDEDADVIY